MAITFDWNVQMSCNQHSWVNFSMHFDWILLMAILVLPSAIAISAIMAINGRYGVYGNHYVNTKMTVMNIQWKSIEKLTQMCWLQLIRTFQSKVMAIWTLVVGAYIVSYNVKMFDLSKSYPHGFRCSNHINPNMFSSGNGPKWKNPTRYSWFDSPWTILSLSTVHHPGEVPAHDQPLWRGGGEQCPRARRCSSHGAPSHGHRAVPKVYHYIKDKNLKKK